MTTTWDRPAAQVTTIGKEPDASDLRILKDLPKDRAIMLIDHFMLNLSSSVAREVIDMVVAQSVSSVFLILCLFLGKLLPVLFELRSLRSLSLVFLG